MFINLHSIAEIEKENIDNIIADVISKDVGIHLAIDDVQSSHRLGPFKNRSTTQEIQNTDQLYFVLPTRGNEQRVSAIKKQLKGKKIFITENLTYAKHKLLLEAF